MITSVTRAAPQQRLIIITLLALLATALSAGYLISIPQLGITWDADRERGLLTVASVSTEAPNAGRIRPGEKVIAVERADGSRIPLFADTIHEDPDLLSYQSYNALLEQHNQLVKEIGTGELKVITESQDAIILQVDSRPSKRAIGYFLVKAGYGWVALLVAAGIWAYSPGRIETRLFLLSGISIFLTTLTLGIYGGRELAISGYVLALAMSVNHLAVLQVSASLTALFWVYPFRQSRLPVHYLILFLGVLAWLADQLQIGASPRYSIYSVIVFGFISGVAVLGRQWHLTRDHPLERASLKWCAISIFIGCLLLTSLIILPPALGGQRGIPLSLSLVSVLVLYLGMAAGLTRYRLFNLEQWWFKTWLWFFGGVLVVLLDLTLIFGLGLAGDIALMLSLVLAGWLYFPLRQGLMHRLGQSRQRNFDLALKTLVDKLFSVNSAGSILSAWPDLLNQTFSPLAIRQLTEHPDGASVAVSTDGARLILPPLETGEPCFQLEFADNGRRLFCPDDLRTADLLRAMSKQALSTVRAREDGAEAERRRIMRDLHDDVGGRILSVLHNANDDRQASLARNALQSLRDALQALDQESLNWLADSIDDWHDLCCQRCDEMAVPLQWSLMGKIDPEQTITVRQRINLSRIIHEGLTNAFKHAIPNYIKVSLHIDGNHLLLEIGNDGVTIGQEENRGIPRRGLNNMQTRAEELEGSFQFQTWNSIATIRVATPIA
ncbi:Putative signal transduction histidine kinase [Alloalcanivorax dieselolei B5]|uniref:Putative signal transduction histidine kinase n=1 Tax=Alcanivorax dieselolei (strain DSM 16502 / CGMCC 1.3690 / MCCC 1A00001 / B-5) TaxID=930169 RepID=K0CBU5_ALCDB|nr:signal transduction histidine kinase [Alloalcanivorax dieselolei]AFT69132.1 Putative signal transduction histidine kinase [Alloalcanivorax dieselolei B5]GGJ82782.1 hypothetical protein GCM10007426_09820 [Alloalcanivorax dieselolei]